MNLIHTLMSAWTAICLLLFVGIIMWAWNGARKSDFDRAARIPLEETAAGAADEKDSEHG